MPVQLDLNDHQALKQQMLEVIESFNGVDGLVYCAYGRILTHGLERSSYEEILDAFNRSAGGFFHAGGFPGGKKVQFVHQLAEQLLGMAAISGR